MKLTIILSFLFTFLYFSDIVALPGTIFSFSEQSSSSDTLNFILEFSGISPKSEVNCNSFITPVINELKGEQPKKLVFKPGTYHFYPEESEQRIYYESNTTDSNPRNCAFLFEGVNNLVIDGNAPGSL